MICKKVFLVVMSLCLVNINYSQLLIVKKESGRFVSLSDADTQKYGAQLAQILLKYTWPTCIASDLTAAEQNELLTADLPYAEEKFVQKKIIELVGNDNVNLQVVWVPQCLYDMFCIFQYYKDQKRYKDEEIKIEAEEALKEQEKASKEEGWELRQIRYGQRLRYIAAKKAETGRIIAEETQSLWRFKESSIRNNMKAILNEINSSVKLINKKINDSFDSENQQYAQGSHNFMISSNNQYVDMLFKKYPEITLQSNAFKVSQALSKKYKEMIVMFKEQMVIIYGNGFVGTSEEYSKNLIFGFSDCDHSILEEIIAIELQAREKNKAVLFRGTKFDIFDFSLHKAGKLAGTTIFAPRGKYQNLLQKNPKLKPFSISFGSSYFGGLLKDCSACVAYYIRDSPGYALFINKKNYVLNRNDKLFFIPPLSYTAALMSKGEFFHARSTVATLQDKQARFAMVTLGKEEDLPTLEIEGIGGKFDPIIDLYGIILIYRDPLKQAELFSRYVAENGVLISCAQKYLRQEFLKKELQKKEETASSYWNIFNWIKKQYGYPDAIKKSPLEQEILQNQTDAAQFYKDVRLVTPKLLNWIQSYRDQKKKNLPVAKSAATKNNQFAKGVNLRKMHNAGDSITIGIDQVLQQQKK